MQVAARAYRPRASTHWEATAGAPPLYTVFAGATLPDHDEELSVVGKERVLWSSGLQMDDDDADDASAAAGSNASSSGVSGRSSSDDAVRLPADHGWGTRVLQSLHFPSAHARSTAGAPDPGTEPPVRGSVGNAGPVLSALWCSFATNAAARSSSQPERQLCVLQKHCLHVVGQDGEVSSVHLPYSARALWPLLEGVLIERESASEAVDTEEMGDADIDDSMRDDQGRVQVPTLFSLLHPLEELKPVAAVEQSGDDIDHDEDSAPLASLLADTAERVVYSCASQPFVLTYHTQRRVHSLWLIRQSRREIFKRVKLEAHAAAGPNSNNVTLAAAADPLALPSSIQDDVDAASRRESMTWQAPHPAARDAPSPVRGAALKPGDLPPLSSPAKPPTPGSAAALAAAAASAALGSRHPAEAEAARATTAFYHQFLFRSFVEEHPLAHPSTYHAPTVATNGVASFVPPYHQPQDREDSAIHCELLLERSWTQPETVEGPCSSVFLACSADNEPLLCMFTERSHTFQAFRLTSSLHSSAVTIDGRIAPAVPRLHLAPLFRCSFQSAVPLYSSLHCSGGASFSAAQNTDPYNFCILALEMDGSLSLFQGERMITRIEVEAKGGKRLTAAPSPSASSSSATTLVAPAHVNTQRGGSALAAVAQTPFKAASDSSFASSASVGFTPLDPNSSAAALFMKTPNQSISGGALAGDSAGSIVQLLDPVSNRVSVRTREGGLYRVAIPARFLSTLVRTCIASLACSLSTELVSSLRSDILQLRTRVLLQEQQQQGLRPQRTSSVPASDLTLSEHHEWTAFVLLVRHLLQFDRISSSAASTAAVAPQSSAPKGDDAWSKLMSSRFHLSRLGHPTLQHLSSSSFALDDSADGCEATGLPRLDFSSVQLVTSSAQLLAELPACFLCLHLVYEELKLPLGGGLVDSTGSTDAARLACQVLKPLAIVQAARDYLDVYARELGGRPGSWNVSAADLAQWGRHRAAADSSSSVSSLPSPPPSIHAFLLQRLHSASSGSAPAVYPLPIVASGQATAAAPSTGVHNFLLSTSLEEPFAWSRKLLLFYDLLTAPDDQPTPPQPQQQLLPPQPQSMVAAPAVPARQPNAGATALAVPSPRVVLSDCINSPYALPVIEQKQIEAQRALLSARTWNIQSASSSFVAPTSSASATPHAVRQLFPTTTANAMMTPYASPSMMPLPSPQLMLSPLLTPLFPTPLASGGTSTRLQQQRRVQAMQLRSVMSAAKASAANSAAASRVSTPQSLLKRPAGKKGRVSFGANTTSATPQAYAASPAGAADANLSTVSNAPSMRGSVAGSILAPSAMEFPLFAPSGSPRPAPRFLSHSAAESIVLAMVSEDFTAEHIDMLAPGLALPLLEALKHVRENPPLNIQPGAAEIAAASAAAVANGSSASRGVVAMWPKEAYTLIGREDLGQMFASMHGGGGNGASAAASGSSNGSSAASSDPERQLDEELEIAAGRPADIELEEPASHGLSGSAMARLAPEPPDLDGTLLVERSTSLRFGRDQRLKEVRHLLRSDRVLCVSLDPSIRQRLDGMGGGGAEVAEENQLRLGIVAKRALSLPVARGMYTLASIQPSLAESLPLPQILLKGRVPPLNSLIDLDLGPHSVQISLTPESLSWPEFHNAVAAALRIQPAPQQSSHASDSFHGAGAQGAEAGADSHRELADAHTRDDVAAVPAASSSHQITRTWIVYNRPTLAPSASAGAAASPAMVGGLSYAHAGFLFGLGLTGHLGCLTPSDFFWYLSQGHEPTAIAMLLGMAACRRGSMDTTVSKMLTLHIPALLPANFSEMSIPSPVQSCALLGIGLLYQGSAHRLMCELLLNEIGRRPGATRADDSFLSERENYAFSAAMGLGLLLLGRGGDPAAMSGLADLQLEKKLATYIHGGKDLAALANRNGGGGGGGLGGGSNGAGLSGAGGADDGEDDSAADGVGWMHSSPLPRVSALGNGVGQGNAGGAGSGAPRNAQHYSEAALSGKNPRVKEGALVNIDVTSPGSTLALALMYLQSNNALVAARFTLPDSLFSLDFIRSDLVFLRVVARNLVGWSGVPEGSTAGLMDKHMPALLPKYVLSLRFYMPKWNANAAAATKAAAAAAATKKRAVKPARSKASMMMDDSDAEDAANGESDDEDDADSADDDADPAAIDGFTGPATLPPGSLSSGAESGSAMREQDIDYATLRQTYLHVVSGNCFSLGLKFAGTAHPRVVSMLTRVLKALRAVAKRRGGGDFVMHTMAGLNPLAQLHKVDRGTLDAALVAVSLGLGLVLAGTGNLGAMKVFRGLLKARPDKQTAAGWHQSISMALGLLFLSGGRATIDTGFGAPPTPGSQARIAYLLLSLYPHLSQNVGEHRYYLSVYRHLYVLAAVPRSLETVDVDTGRACYVPLEVVVAVPPSASAAAAATKGQQQQQQVQKVRTRRLRFITPCLLPSYDSILSIRIVSPRFHALALHFPSAAGGQLAAGSSNGGGARGMVHPSSLQRIFVKKKLGVEGYEKDSLGQRSFHHRVFPSSIALLSRALTEADAADDEQGAPEVKDERKAFLKSFSTDARLRSFTHLFLREHAPSAVLAGPTAALDAYLSAVLYECLTEEKFFQMIAIYLDLFPLTAAPVDGDATARSADEAASRRMLEAKLASTDCVWSLLLMREYYERFRVLAQQAQRGGGVGADPAVAASATSRRSKQTKPFHLLPLAEGSASVVLSDPETASSAALSVETLQQQQLRERVSPPLLSAAFLSAIVLRVDSAFESNAELQTAFRAYVRQLCADAAAGQASVPLPSRSSVSSASASDKIGGKGRVELAHPMLGSLLLWWRLPAPSVLAEGLALLRQQASATPSSTRLLLAGLLWPCMPPVAIRALLAAISSA